MHSQRQHRPLSSTRGLLRVRTSEMSSWNQNDAVRYVRTSIVASALRDHLVTAPQLPRRVPSPTTNSNEISPFPLHLPTSRGRQSGRPGGSSLFGDASSVEMQMRNDPETLERDNDAAIGHMSDRVAMLRSITDNIHNEAELHKKLLDGMGDSMGGVGETLGETVKHFNAVFVNNKNGRQFCYAVWGIVGVIWCLHYLSSG